MSKHDHADASGSAHGHHHGFQDIEKWIAILDNPERDKKQFPDEVIARLEIQANDLIADIGAGTGYFAIRIATAYPQAQVFAVDTEHEMVEYLQSQSKQRKLANLVPVLIDPSRPQLPSKLNLALMVDTLHHIADRRAYLACLKESMALGSRIAVIDYRQAAPEGPPAHFRIPVDELVEEFRSIGYELESDINLLPNQFFLVFRRE
jgi:SAM-dependent methyltransferase